MLVHSSQMVSLFVKIYFLFLLSLSQQAIDYKSKCLTTFLGMWYFGSCYIHIGAAKNWTQAMTTCNGLSLSLPTIYSEQEAVALYNFFLPKMTSTTTNQIWIGAQNTGTSYQFFKKNTLTNGVPVTQYPIGNDTTYWNVNGTGSCVYMRNSTDGSVHFYAGNCSVSYSYLCQYFPKFYQKSCDYFLQEAPGVTNLTMTASSPSLCTQYCANQQWCSGVNYNAGTQQCDLCTVNTLNFTNTENLTIAMVPNPCWTFYERNICDVPGQKC